jgi:hypothetical protein
MVGVRQEVWNRFLELLRSEDERIALKATTWYLDRLLSVPGIVQRLGSPNDQDPVIPPSLHALLASDPISTEDTGS